MALRLPAVLAATAVAAVLAGCGQDLSGVDTAQIRSVVEQFAEADDAHACELLSPHALQNLYGEFEKPVSVARANCVRQSKKFEAEPVVIENLNVIDTERARVSAVDPSGEVAYGVSLRRYGPSWRIESISQAKND
jgi:hypothetical protein